MAVGLSITQFALLFLLSTLGARIGWRHPGVPIVYNIGIKLLYFAATIGIAFWLASLAFKTGVFPGVMAVLVAVLLIYIPLLSGLPLWLLVSIGLRPTFLAQIPFRLAALFFQAVRGFGGGKDGFGGAHDGQQKAGSGSSSSEDRYHAACATFELQPYAFTRTQLKNRYQTLMQKVHPDARGSTGLAAIV